MNLSRRPLDAFVCPVCADAVVGGAEHEALPHGATSPSATGRTTADPKRDRKVACRLGVAALAAVVLSTLVSPTLPAPADQVSELPTGAVTGPEHADPLSFNPNSIKYIKAADPGAGISLIEPPGANNTGEDRLSYPIEVPHDAPLRPDKVGSPWAEVSQLPGAFSDADHTGHLHLGWRATNPTVPADHEGNSL